MPFVNGYPTEGDIKPPLYILDPQQTHDLIQPSIPFNIAKWLYTLIDQRHHFFGIYYSPGGYIIERYTPEDYSYAWDFSLKYYEFLKYLSTFNYIITSQHHLSNPSGFEFGNEFIQLSNIDNTPYERNYDDILKISLPQTDNPDDWITITFYETLPWIIEEYFDYANPDEGSSFKRTTTLLTQSDLAFYEIPELRSIYEVGGARIILDPEIPGNNHYIQILYQYSFQGLATDFCLRDPPARRFNLSNNKYEPKGQEINVNTRWLIGYTMVVDSNNSTLSNLVIDQIPEHYLYKNFQSYLNLLKTEVENQFPVKKILLNFSQSISFAQSLNLSTTYQSEFNAAIGGETVVGIGQQEIDVSYSPSAISYGFADIIPEAHYFANLVYGNNNLYGNQKGITTSFPDLGIGIHIRKEGENDFRLDNGRVNSLDPSDIRGGLGVEKNNFSTGAAASRIYTSGVIRNRNYKRRSSFSFESSEDEIGNFHVSIDRPLTSISHFNAYSIYSPWVSLVDSSLYSSCRIPFLFFAEVQARLIRGEENPLEYKYEEFSIALTREYSLNDSSRISHYEYTGNRTNFYNPTQGIDVEDGDETFYYGNTSSGSSRPHGKFFAAFLIAGAEVESGAVSATLDHSFGHIFNVLGSGEIRTEPEPRSFSANEAAFPANLETFNQLYFEECSCMTAQVAQEILDLVKEIHATLDAGKFAYLEGEEAKRVANLGYYVERIARVLGISVNSDGSIRSIRQSKLIDSGNTIPSGWNLGQFGRNQGGNSEGQTGGKETEDRDGLAYAVRSNSFGTDPYTGEANLIKEGGYVLVENLPQLIHLILDDLDRAFGLQNAGANVIPSPNGELIPIQGINNILLELLYTLGQTNKSASKTHISSLITQAISKEILQALGVPLTIKKMPVGIDEDKKGYIPIPGTTNRSCSVIDLQLLSLINIASILEGKIDFKVEDSE
ncbi:MAG: hypothetical protein AB4372_10105 [Xenococcus sp. (in: cyanobacteria)]